MLLDALVPFTTEREGPTGVRFSGQVELADAELTIDASVDIGSLDEAMRGHATLRLVVRRGEALLGQGSLRPGHFVELDEGFRVGFTGLRKWSEIDVSRRTHSRTVRLGAGLALLGAVVWPVAHWRRW